MLNKKREIFRSIYNNLRKEKRKKKENKKRYQIFKYFSTTKMGKLNGTDERKVKRERESANHFHSRTFFKNKIRDEVFELFFFCLDKVKG